MAADLEHPMTMAGRVALVTGGGSGLGRATCLLLAGSGATVLVADVNAAGAAETVELAAAQGRDARVLELDVTDSGQVDQALAAAFHEHGQALDCLVNNAGTDQGADLPDVTDEQWHAVFGVNVHGPMHTSRAFLRHVVALGPRERPADIVSVVSISALTVGSGAAAYNSSKAALLKLTEVLQSETRERGWPVRVCAISPSAMNTPMMEQWHLADEQMMDPAGVASLIRTAVMLPPSMVLQSLVVTSRNEYYPR
ncbi:MAG: putative dehydrogenase [Nocardioidaceae bacterium]|nr:putative dehydrogenase [Nocardioidaceae bacterium]